MFYSQFILAKKGPLGNIWIAAHLERKLRKNQVADTDIGVSVDSILFPEVPIALRLSSHLLLGVVRIYSRKVNYLFHDCSEALLQIKQAFRSTVVDLPPDESTAPYHSITLPETFDLDDFELPDSALFQGNYVDHHVSTREQITLQDTMDGVVYSTSQFGLDERFGDGDTSQIGLDLDEDLFSDKAAASQHAEDLLPSEENVGPACGEPMTPFTGMDIVEDDNNNEMTGEIPEVILFDGSGKHIGSDAQEVKMDDKSAIHNDQIKSPDLNAEGFWYKQIEGQSANPTTDLVGFTLSPSTNALADDAILANVEEDLNKMASPCQSQDWNSINLVVTGKPGDSIKGPDAHIGNENNALECLLLNDENSGADVLCMPSGKNESLMGGVQAIHVKQQGYSTPSAEGMDPVISGISRLVSSPTSVLAEQPKPVSPVSECSDRIAAVLDGQDGVISNNGLSIYISPIEQIHAKGMATQEIAVDTTVAFSACSHEAIMLEEACSRPPCEYDSVSNKETSDSEALKSVELVGDGAELCSCIQELQSGADFQSGSVVRYELDQVEGNPSAQPQDSNIMNRYGPSEKSHAGSHLLQPCSLQSNQLGVSSLPDGSFVENIPDMSCRGDGLCFTPAAERGEMPQGSTPSVDMQGEGCNQGLVGNPIVEPFQSEDVQAVSKLDEHLNGVVLEDTQLQTSNFSASSDLPAPETLLSVPEGAELPADVMLEPILDEGSHPTKGSGDVSKILSGKRYRSIEYTPVLQSGNSAKLSGVPQSRNVDSIPDDNDLLSSILVGRRSSALKVRPTPPSEVPSSKRLRVATRVHAPKRKVLLDDTMVLHGDTIRQQLTNTEDIRRIQRKAPCTRPEIWMIQKQLLEIEIFNEPIFTGMSMQLIDLQNRTYDFSKAGLPQIDANCTPLGVQKGREQAVSINVAKETGLEGCSEDVAVRNDGEMLPAGIHVQVEEKHSKEHAILEGCGVVVLVTNEGEAQTASLDSSKDGRLEEINAMEINRVDDGISDVMGHAATQGSKLAVPSGPLSGDNSNLLADSLKLSPVDNSCGAEVILQNDEGHSPKDQKLGLQPDEKGALIMGDNDGNDVQALHIVEVNGKSSISPKAVPAAKDESSPVEAEGGLLSEFPQDCQIGVEENTSSPIGAAELDNCSVVTRADVQLDSSALSFETINSSFPSMCLDSGEQTVVVIVTGDQNLGGNNGLLDKNVMRSEQVRDEDGVTIRMEDAILEPNMDMEDVSSHRGGDPGCMGANQKNTTDAENSMLHSSAARDSDVFEDVMDENDTDDDEVAGEEDNNMPSAEEFFENSGWSSRTRAVARYLQTLFDNDAGHERKVVHMDNLLAGKTRKESARMFFETLVLKTRDYIHVEQENSFDNINIKSRGKLMKANF
ncbi:sister chromatid cohesion 1 protein 4-like isoform X2 [Telopea speciosissima]|uniref:sister chromatid cohesion 1 protein 4-like isoform X2 n=1 Tax=Telopea speciosissima TaxID=54955 RepID=UPI001CC373ED|nr:sister chromatid cohesion 1 protein 4-like isoform X2 [Telopea speciosissima]